MSMVVDQWDEESGDWRPDEWDRRVEAVVAERDRVAGSVDGPVPVWGTAEWAAADEQTKAASQAQFDQARDVARGEEISDRMTAEGSERAARVEAEKEMAGGWARAGYASDQLPDDVREQRETDHEHRESQPRPWDDGYADSFPEVSIPEQREPQEGLQRDSTADAVEGAREALRQLAAERDEPTHGDESGTRVARSRVDEDAATRTRV